jgi:hypothetical protein
VGPAFCTPTAAGPPATVFAEGPINGFLVTPRSSTDDRRPTGQGTELVDLPPFATTHTTVEYVNVETVDNLNATPNTRWIT